MTKVVSTELLRRPAGFSVERISATGRSPVHLWLVVALVSTMFAASAQAQNSPLTGWQQNFSAGQWYLGCSTSGRLTVSKHCLIAAQIRDPRDASYKLTISPQDGNVVFSGFPKMLMAVARVDNNPNETCGTSDGMVCSFAGAKLKSQLDRGNQMLIDVHTLSGTREITLQLGGLRACLAKMREWGY